MSVVVAIKENGKIMMGADSQCTKGGTRRSLSNPNNYKIWKVLDSENCLLGHVGLVREANVIRVARDLIPEMAQLKDKVDFSFVVKRLVPTMFEELEEYRVIKKVETNPESPFKKEAAAKQAPAEKPAAAPAKKAPAEKKAENESDDFDDIFDMFKKK